MSDFSEAWGKHPLTRQLRKGLETKLERAKETLVNKAKVTTDPDVRAAYQDLAAIKQLLDAMDKELER